MGAGYLHRAVLMCALAWAATVGLQPALANDIAAGDKVVTTVDLTFDNDNLHLTIPAWTVLTAGQVGEDWLQANYEHDNRPVWLQIAKDKVVTLHWYKARLDQFLEADPTHATAYLERGMCRVNLDDRQGAIRDLTAAVGYDDTLEPAFRQRACLYYADGQREKAYHDFQKAVALGCREAWVPATLGDICTVQGRYIEAIVHYSDAIDFSPPNGQLYRCRSNCFELTGQYELAHQDATTANILATGLLHASDSADDSHALRPDQMLYLLGTLDQRAESVVVQLLRVEDSPQITIQVVEAERDKHSLTQYESRRWRATIPRPDAGRRVATEVLRNLQYLREIQHGEAPIAAVGRCRFVQLTYHFPRTMTLPLPDRKDIVLSQRTQQNLTLQSASDYPASRKVLIVNEPHQDVQQHFALQAGLEDLLADNPWLRSPGACVFLSEGYAAGRRMPIECLRHAQPSPRDSLIRSVLCTYLVPSYVTLLWKHPYSIPVIGTEDPDLHRLSNYLHACQWQLAQRHVGGGDQQLAQVTWLARHSVAARNTSIATTVLAQLAWYDCPILFVGAGHVPAIEDPELYSNPPWDDFEGILDSRDLARLRAGTIWSVADWLRERQVGYYLLTARSAVLPDPQTQSSEINRYVAVRLAQVNGEMASYTASLGQSGRNCTVAPSPNEAAKVVRALASYNQEQGSGEEEHEEGDEPGPTPFGFWIIDEGGNRVWIATDSDGDLIIDAPPRHPVIKGIVDLLLELSGVDDVEANEIIGN